MEGKKIGRPVGAKNKAPRKPAVRANAKKDPGMLGMAADLELAKKEFGEDSPQFKQIEQRRQLADYMQSFDCSGPTRQVRLGNKLTAGLKCVFGCGRDAAFIASGKRPCCSENGAKCPAVNEARVRNRMKAIALKAGRPTEA